MRVVCAMGSILLSFMAYAPADASYLMSGSTYVHKDRQRTHHVRAAVRSIVAYGSNGTVQHPPGCPRFLFCGCAASARVFGHPVRSLYLVRNWYQFPRTAPAPGMAVLFGASHVAIIEQYHGDGSATLYDPNSGGGLTRIHRVKISGLVVVNPQGQQFRETTSRAPSNNRIARYTRQSGYMGF